MTRWDELFADLDGRFAEEERAQELGSVPDRVRRDRAQVTLADRLRASLGRPLAVRLPGGRAVEGVVAEVGDGWVGLRLAGGAGAVVVLESALALEPVGESAQPPGRVRLGLGAALRGLARDRRPVRLVDRTGEQHEGVLDRVGQDHLDLVLSPGDVGLRERRARRRLTVPLAAVAAVRQL